MTQEMIDIFISMVLEYAQEQERQKAENEVDKKKGRKIWKKK